MNTYPQSSENLTFYRGGSSSVAICNVMAKKKSMDLPDWAVQIWEAMGSPDLQDLQSVHNGDLLERRHGLRKDDIVEILIDARALVEGEANTIKGRLLSSGKTSIEVLTQSGDIIYLARDVIVKITLIAHKYLLLC